MCRACRSPSQSRTIRPRGTIRTHLANERTFRTATGFAGVDNPRFVAPDAQMLFGDAKASINDLIGAVGEV